MQFLSEDDVNQLLGNLDKYWRKLVTYKFDPLSDEDFFNVANTIHKKRSNKFINYRDGRVTNGTFTFIFQSSDECAYYKCKLCDDDCLGSCYECSLNNFKKYLVDYLKDLQRMHINRVDSGDCIICNEPTSTLYGRDFDSPRTLFCYKHITSELTIL